MSPGRHIVSGLGLWLFAWALFNWHGPQDLSAAVRNYQDSPSCREDRVLTDAPDPTLTGPLADRCVIQQLPVARKYYTEQHPIGHQTIQYQYWITTVFPWGPRHSVQIRSRRDGRFSLVASADREVYDSIAQGQTVNALMLGQRVAVLAVDGRAISTSDDPDVQRSLEAGKQLAAKVLVGLGLLSLILAIRGVISARSSSSATRAESP